MIPPFVSLPWSHAVISTQNLTGITFYSDGIVCQLIFHYRTDNGTFVIPVNYSVAGEENNRILDLKHVVAVLGL